MSGWSEYFSYLNLALTVVVLWRLWSLNIAHTYQALVCYLSADLILSMGALSFAPRTESYAIYYFGSQALKFVIAGWAVAEIYSLTLEKTPALAQFGRNSVVYILIAAALLPGIALVMDSTKAKSIYPVLHRIFLFEQTIASTIGIFLLILSVFVAYFPVQMRRNVLYYASGFIIWELSRSVAVYLVNNRMGNEAFLSKLNFGQSCIETCCLCFWIYSFRPEGEKMTGPISRFVRRGDPKQLIDQLTAINDSLERLRHR